MKRIVKLTESDIRKLVGNILNEMKLEILAEQNQNFDRWRMPSLDKLKLEYKVEHELKGNHFFDSEEDFLDAVENGRIVEVSDEDMDDVISDYRISYRSRTSSKDDLLDLIRGYRSYPQFRNEQTVEAIYDGFKNNSPMDYPIVIEFKSGRYRVFSGNTRMDIAFQLGINPKVLLIRSRY